MMDMQWEFLFAPPRLLSTLFFIKKLNYPLLFSPHSCSRLLPPFDAAPSPPLPNNAPPSPVPSPSPFQHRPSSFRLLFHPQHPSFTLRHVLSRYPSGSSAPALSRCPFGFPVPALFSLQRPSSFGTVRSNRTEQRPFVHGRTKALRSAKQDRTGALRSVLYGRTVPKGRRVLGTGTKKPGRSVGRKHVPKSGGRVIGKRKEMGREVVLRRGKGMVPERRCIGGGLWREKIGR